MFMNFENRSKSVQVLSGILLISAFNTVGCKAKTTTPVSPIKVTNVSVNTSLAANQDELLSFSITLSTQNFTVAGVTLPIFNPNNNSQQYGSISLQPVLCTTPATCPYGNSVQITANLNMTGILSAKGVAPLLPNGAALPVAGLQNSTVIALPIANTGAAIYFAFGPNVAMFGAAIPFAQLNVVGQSVPGANLFIPVTITTDKGAFTLLPGFFTGSAPNTTGIGFFADLSGIVPHSALLASLTKNPAQQTSSTAVEFGGQQQAASSSFKSALVFSTVAPKNKTLNHFYQELIKANEKGGYLNLQ
jgi:hypothetical protein